MKIGFPLTKNAAGHDLEFDLNLHSSNYFGVFDSIDESIKILSTAELSDDKQGLGFIHFLKGEDIISVISPECHTMAAKFFSDNNIGIYKASGRNALKNIELLLNSQLPLFTAQNAIKSKCGSDCSSCSTGCSTTDNVQQDIVSI